MTMDQTDVQVDRISSSDGDFCQLELEDRLKVFTVILNVFGFPLQHTKVSSSTEKSESASI